jgi:hypothetical protein
VPDGTDAVDQRDQIIRLLRALPPRQRTAVVLRYWEELSEAETARAMGCSVGTVKAACSRGLRRLRELSGSAAGGGAPPAAHRAALRARATSHRPNPQGEWHEHRFRGAVAGGHGAGPGAPAAGPGAGKCGAFTVAGRQWVDGVDAIKLAGHTTGPGSAIWVNPGSYLPVRLVTHLREVQAGKESEYGAVQHHADDRLPLAATDKGEPGEADRAHP